MEKQSRSRPKEEILQKFFTLNPEFVSDGFDFPVGKPNGKGYVNVQVFQSKRGHLGEDWNNASREDMGDPVYSSANGLVTYAHYAGSGWGNVLIISHKLPDGRYVETLYGHLEKMRAYEGMKVLRGENIGTIGDADGAYWPHLHFELRDDVNISVGHGYGNPKGYLDPTQFIKRNRKF